VARIAVAIASRRRLGPPGEAILSVPILAAGEEPLLERMREKGIRRTKANIAAAGEAAQAGVRLTLPNIARVKRILARGGELSTEAVEAERDAARKPQGEKPGRATHGRCSKRGLLEACGLEVRAEALSLPSRDVRRAVKILSAGGAEAAIPRFYPCISAIASEGETGRGEAFETLSLLVKVAPERMRDAFRKLSASPYYCGEMERFEASRLGMELLAMVSERVGTEGARRATGAGE
jgi:hypothetical protein